MKANIPEVPRHLDSATRSFLQSMREIVVALHSARVPAPPSNLQVSPVAVGNIIQFTRSSDADKHIVYWSTTPSLAAAVAVDVGQAAQWHDNVGDAAKTRFYWVKAKNGDIDSTILGPKSGTTLGIATTTTVAGPPPSSDVTYTDQSSGRNEPGIGKETL